MMDGDRDLPRLRARYQRRVTGEHVGERVSVRHVLPEDGLRLTDVVGRLQVFDDEVMMVVDRHRQLHVIGHDAVVASRVVPPHPRREPEPDLGTQEAPLGRRAARLLLVDGRDRVLLVAHDPGGGRAVWTAPGGGLRPGEDHGTAAAREAREELGMAVTIGPWVWRRRETFSFRGLWLDQDERWFLARTDGFDPAGAPLPDHGATAARWWTADDLRASDVEVAPAALADHLEALLRDGPPPEPIDVGR